VDPVLGWEVVEREQHVEAGQSRVDIRSWDATRGQTRVFSDAIARAPL
jgi:hypothetical protein